LKIINKLLIIIFPFFSVSLSADTVIVDPSKIQLHKHVHESLSPQLLSRIKKLTNTFEIVDGITYEQSVDLYKRDIDPESNIVIFEEMARVYKQFCVNRCTTDSERQDVYKLVLLRSMFSDQEVLKRAELNVVNEKEAKTIIKSYKLKAEPIKVIQQ